ncbi:PQQ-dependent sugar dehydrogenase [Cognatiyoonia sp. IB215182]|uniref:PQQ-dependent sugar dehydrogenase n=1 Tax=Cognatiyoonia sp. IB215182 TaxID=3097353 RepID=UPI002A0B3DDA|nr:PQQ-dependent sugar dehydrogenase [Cognatiyoonia sp. IB215182]MDX8350862.1 PQQ-dependent sugar dehydrogenase [Cognatiyoonia sp. IB215182]
MTHGTTPSDGLHVILATVAFSTTTLFTAPTFAQTAIDAPHATIVEATEITRDLEQPWRHTFLPDGTALVTSGNTGDIRRVDPSMGPHTSVGFVSDVDAWNDSGLLGIAVSPTVSPIMHAMGRKSCTVSDTRQSAPTTITSSLAPLSLV